MKEPDSYLFTAEVNHSKPLDRVAITRDVNKVMREVSNQLPGKFNITSGYTEAHERAQSHYEGYPWENKF